MCFTYFVIRVFEIIAFSTSSVVVSMIPVRVDRAPIRTRLSTSRRRLHVVELPVEVVASPVREGVVKQVGFVVLQSHDDR